MRTFLSSILFLVVLSVCVSAQSSRVNGEKYLSFLFDEQPVFDTLQQVAAEAIVAEETWRSWKTVNNFAFGKDRGQLPMIADLQGLHPFFRDRILLLIRNCRAKGIELAIVESYRTHTKQSEYFRMGRQYTRSAGGKSKHQYGLAIDVVPLRDSVAVWDDAGLWRKVGVEGEKLGLRWGGRWRSPYDPAHFEWTGGITTAELSKGFFPPIPVAYATSYPCIDEDLKQLREHWVAWEKYHQELVTKPSNATATAVSASSQ